jgi:hypothetical protein
MRGEARVVDAFRSLVGEEGGKTEPEVEFVDLVAGIPFA